MKQLSISAVIITRNEERNLPSFLANVLPLADEVVIVDDGSTDATLRLAHEAGPKVRVVSRRMDNGGFAAQRNAGLAEAQGDWILNMDCDERLSPQLIDELRAVLPASTLNAYKYTRLNYFMNRPMRHGGWNTWNRPQIARAGAHRFEGRLHERCEIDGGDAMTGQLTGLMHHLNDFNLAQRFDKSARYTSMEADRVSAAGPVRARDLWWRPLREFGKKYVAQQGFRDGTPGFISAIHSATAMFRAYALAWDQQNAVPRDRIEVQCNSRSQP